MTKTKVNSRPIVVFAIFTLVFLFFDWITKSVALSQLSDENIHVVGPIDLVLARNKGGAFSLAHDSGVFPWLVTGLVMCLGVWMVRAVVSGNERFSGTMLIVAALILAGALGNQVDRWLRVPYWNRGSVIDFISVGFWPIFNLADSYLVVGAVIATLRLGAKQK